MLKSTVLNAVAVAKRAVQDLAVPAVLVQRGEVSHVPGLAPDYPVVNSAVQVVITEYDSKEIDNDRILASDLQGLIFPETGQPVPKPNDQLRVGVVTYRIIQNRRVMAGDSLALSQTQLRLS